MTLTKILDNFFYGQGLQMLIMIFSCVVYIFIYSGMPISLDAKLEPWDMLKS